MPPVSTRVALLAASLLLPAASSHAAGAADADLRLGVEADNAPFESVGPDGALRGFDIDLGNAICARAHYHCTWVNMDFDGLIPALAAHRIDAADSEMSVTQARSGRVLFTLPVARTAAVMVAPKGSSVTDAPASLAGKTIGVQSGTTHETYAKEKLAPATTVEVYQSQLQAFQDLADGRIDATLCDEGAASDWIGRQSGFAIVGKPIDDPAVFGSGTAIALRLGDTATKARLDAAIRAVLADGTYATINRRWFPFSIAPTLPAA